jgi:hypothetical protein
MASSRIFNRVDVLLQHFTPDQLVDEIFQGLSDSEADSIIDHIERMWDIGEDEEEEYDDEEFEDEDELLEDEEDLSLLNDLESEVDDEEGNVLNNVLSFRRKSEE